jgi:hypothetical protein
MIKHAAFPALGSNQVYLIKAIRCVTWFQSLNFDTIANATDELGRAADAYQRLAYGVVGGCDD